MADLKLRWSAEDRRYVLCLAASGEPELDDGVAQTAAIAAVATWARAKEGDVLPGFSGDVKGHWADYLDPRGRKGCRAWLLAGRILNQRTLDDAKAYIEEALDGLIPDWISGYQVLVWRAGAATGAARAILILPDGRQDSVDIELNSIITG